ncbi:MAG: selenide, water dikinase SelD, partial [Deltaproteobacteria bacterium]|nr:selenide, water dikinase SelD [Deltaproteobacteria bacterium]
TIEDREIKYGLAVTGFVHPEKVVTNSRAMPGDRLILTKSIGAGVVTTALKFGRCSDEEAAYAIESMRGLNRTAASIMVETGVSACTDITGFGLLGHAVEMCEASGVGMIIRSGSVRFFKGAIELVAKKKNRPRTLESNMEFLSLRIRRTAALDKARYMLFFDPQTSGGLLISLPEDRALQLVRRLRSEGVDAHVVGDVVEREKDWVVSVE